MLVDTYGRHFSYLRLSVTEACNFRCSYCLPHGYRAASGCPEFLRVDEILRLCQGFASLGFHKVRLTGGEPTVRSDIVEIIRGVSSVSGVRKVLLSTNGFRLSKRIDDFHRAGLNGINVSMDSLEPDTFRQVTGRASLSDVLQGIDRALELGMEAVKINTVALRGVNDHQLSLFLDYIHHRPVSVRFIELMPSNDRRYYQDHHVSLRPFRDRLIREGWRAGASTSDSGPAEVMQHSDYVGTLGFINPYKKNFCDQCNRLRISAQGALRLCLFGESQASLRHLLQNDGDQEELGEEIIRLLRLKPSGHNLQALDTGMNTSFSHIGG